MFCYDKNSMCKIAHHECVPSCVGLQQGAALSITHPTTNQSVCRALSSSAQPRMVYLSPVTKNRNAGPLQTPSPKGRNPISIFGLAQTPGVPGLMSGFPGTPVSDAMTAASWLHDMSLRHPQQVRLGVAAYAASFLHALTLHSAYL